MRSDRVPMTRPGDAGEASRTSRGAGGPSDVRARVVAIDALSQTLGGGLSVAANLIEALARQRGGARFLVLCSTAELAAHDFPPNVEVLFRPGLGTPGRRTLFQQLALPRLLSERGVEVLLALGGFAVFTSRVPQVSVWQNPNIFTRVRVPRTLALRGYIALQRLAQGLSMRKAALNVFLTHESRREAASRWPLARLPHRVIPHGIAPPSAETPAPADGGDPLVLAVGHAYFHKNYETLIDAVAHYHARYGGGLRVEIAGGAVDARYHDSLEARIRSRGVGHALRFLGPTPFPEVVRLYGTARVYVVTSLLESFGLTPLEAMSRGLPVLASRASCIPEVCGDAALYCDPYDAEDVAHKLHRLLGDESLRKRLRARGRARAASFAWADRAREYLAALDACLVDPAGGGRG